MSGLMVLPSMETMEAFWEFVREKRKRSRVMKCEERGLRSYSMVKRKHREQRYNCLDRRNRSVSSMHGITEKRRHHLIVFHQDKIRMALSRRYSVCESIKLLSFKSYFI